MKKLFVSLLLLILLPFVGYAQIWEGSGGQSIDEGIGFGSGSGIDISDWDGATIDVTFTNNVDGDSFTITGFPAGFPFSTLMDSIPPSYLEKTGYTYNGVINQPTVLPTGVESVSYVLSYSANMYTIQYWSDVDTDYATQTVAYNSIIAPPADPTYTTPNDFFYEWLDLPSRMPDHDIVVYADHGTDYYGFELNMSTGAITYLADAAGKVPITVNGSVIGNWTSNDSTSWKDWICKIARPCMLKSDGTVDYYLDMDNQSLKADGTSSDISNFNYDGNAMVEFKRVYTSMSISNGVLTCYLCRGKRDNSYTAHAFEKSDGTLGRYVYFSMFKGRLDSNSPKRLRSIASTSNTPSFVGAGKSSIEEFSQYCKNNGSEDYDQCYYSIFSYITTLHLLVGKTTDVQAVFGGGVTGGSQIEKEGSLAGYGAFYGLPATWHTGSDWSGVPTGTDLSSFQSQVKTFWISNLWGNGGVYCNGITKYGNGKQTLYVKSRAPYVVPNTTSDTDLTGYSQVPIGSDNFLTVDNNIIAVMTTTAVAANGYDSIDWGSGSGSKYCWYWVRGEPSSMYSLEGIFSCLFKTNQNGNNTRLTFIR